MNIIEKFYNWAYIPGNRSLTTHLILHHTATPFADPEGLHERHMSNSLAGIAYHYFVTKGGEIYRGRPELWRSGHPERWSYVAISVCFEGNFEIEEMGGPQKTAGREIVAYIKGRYPGLTAVCYSDLSKSFPSMDNLPKEYICGETESADPEPPQKSEMFLPSPSEDPLEQAKAWAAEAGLILPGGETEVLWNASVSLEALILILKRYSDMEK